MVTIGTILLVVGFIVGLIGMIQILILAFREHILWGIGCLLLPFVPLIFAALHWPSARKPFLLYLVGWVAVLVGSQMSGTSLT